MCGKNVLPRCNGVCAREHHFRVRGMTADQPTCSFCYEPADKVDVLVASPFAHICDKCIALSSEIVQEHRIRKLIKKYQTESKQDASSS